MKLALKTPGRDDQKIEVDNFHGIRPAMVAWQEYTESTDITAVMIEGDGFEPGDRIARLRFEWID
jgi:hypothetical protein